MGSLNANGIWHYTEADLASLYSDMLNLLGDSITTQVALLQASVNNAWVPYTPAIAGLVVGNGTLTVRSKKVGKTVTVAGFFRAGSTSTFSGPFLMAVPYPVNAGGTWADAVPLGVCTFQDASAATVAQGVVAPWSATQVALRSGSSIASNSIPFTWAVSDVFGFTYTYEAA